MLYDRPYMRRMMFNGEVKPFAVSLIITLVISFVFVSLLRLFSSEWYNLCFQFLSFKSSDHGITILWRLVTYILLHDGPFHLIMNLLEFFHRSSSRNRNWQKRFHISLFHFCCLWLFILVHI